MKPVGRFTADAVMETRVPIHQRGSGQHWISRAVFRLDAWLRRRNWVYEYTHDARRIFRVQIASAAREIVVADGTAIRPGGRILDLHIRNEQFPAFPMGPRPEAGRSG